MRLIASLLLLMLLSFSQVALAEEGYCDDAETTADMIKCGHIYWKRDDAALQMIYDDLIKELKQDDEDYPLIGPSRTGSREEALRQAQRSWIKFRDDHCHAETLIKGDGGTISGPIEMACLTEITKERALELQKLSNFNQEN